MITSEDKYLIELKKKNVIFIYTFYNAELLRNIYQHCLGQDTFKTPTRTIFSNRINFPK